MIFNLKVQKYGELVNLNLEIQVKNSIWIILSDPLNPSFIAQLNLTPSIFADLVKEQELRMEYEEFVDQLKSLLVKDEWTKVFDKDNNFKLVEITSWRAICHLKLKMDIPSLDQKNQYLADKLLAEKESTAKLNEKMIKIENTLKAEVRQYSLKVKELQEMLKSTNEKFVAHQSAHQFEIKDLNQNHQEQIEAIESKYITNAGDSRHELSALRAEYDSLKVQHASFVRQNNSLQAELQRYHQDATKWSTESSTYQNELGMAKNRLNMLEQELSHKTNELHQLKQSHQQDINEKSAIESKVRDLESQLASISHSVNNTNNEVNKGNSIIEELEQDLRQSKNKLKLSTQLALTQEDKINELTAELKELRDKNQPTDKLMHDNYNLQKKLNFAHNRLEVKQVDDWLQKESINPPTQPGKRIIMYRPKEKV